MASEPDPAGLVKPLGGLTRGAAIAGLALGLALGCSKKLATPAPQPARADTVYAVNYPLAYFAERLAPEGMEVVFPAPPEVDPAYWKPAPEVIGRYQKAGLILLNGAGYARWTRYATLPKSRTVVTARGCRDVFLESGNSVEHQHGPEGEHAHEGTAFTTWLDMRLARCQASRIRDALLDRAPADAGSINSRFAELERDLLALDTRLRKAAQAWNAQPVLASHPVYQYLADAYALRIESLHFEPGQQLGPEELEALDALLSEHPAKLMLWEGPPQPQTLEQLSRRGIAAVVFEPAAQPPEGGDFLAAMHANAERLACATGAESCP